MVTHQSIPMIVLTGGPSAGKTAVLEMVRRMVCPHVAILPEAAGILFGGGFWRLSSESSRRSAQRAIYHVQTELERMAAGEPIYKLAVCDRGTLDGLAYWPGSKEDFLSELNVDRARELAKYQMVIHLRTPAPGEYNYTNPLRIESPEEALRIDSEVEKAWAGHPHRHFVNKHINFIDKADAAMRLILAQVPNCCSVVGENLGELKRREDA